MPYPYGGGQYDGDIKPMAYGPPPSSMPERQASAAPPRSPAPGRYDDEDSWVHKPLPLQEWASRPQRTDQFARAVGAVLPDWGWQEWAKQAGTWNWGKLWGGEAAGPNLGAFAVRAIPSVYGAAKGIYSLLRTPSGLLDSVSPALGAPQKMGEWLFGIESAPDSSFTVEQIVAGKTVAEAVSYYGFDASRRNQYDIGDYNKYFSESAVARRYPTLTMAGQQIDRVLPWSPWRGYQGAEAFWKEFQTEPGDLLLDLGLSASGFGAGVAAARQVIRPFRMLSRAIDPLSDLPKVFDDVNVLTGEVSAARRLQEGTVEIDVLGRRSLRNFGRRERVRTGLGFALEDQTVATAAHVIVGHEGAPGVARRIRARAFSGDVVDVSGVRTDLEVDTAILDLPRLPGVRGMSLADSSRLMGLDERMGNVLGTYRGSLGFTDYQSVRGASGMGLVSESGEAAGMYLGVLGGRGIFTPASRIEALRRSGSPFTKIEDLDYATEQSDLASRGLHYQAASALRSLRMDTARGAAIGLHSGGSFFEGRDYELPMSSTELSNVFSALDEGATRAFDLSPSQRAAMEHRTGRGIVLAGPGSGKSRVLMERLNFLADENIADPENILTLVFGKNVQEELVERGRKAGRNWNISTLDAFSRNIVRENYEALGYSRPPDISRGTFRDWIMQSQGRLKGIGVDLPPSPKVIAEQWARDYESRRTTFLEGRENYEGLDIPLQHAIQMFRKDKISTNRMDFTDAMTQASYLLEQDVGVRDRIRKQFSFVQIDEFQDVSPLQNRLLQQISPPGGNLWAVGDLDQSIMGFRGGTGEVMRGMLGSDASVYRLAENFRSTPEIVGAAQAFIGRHTDRFDVPQSAMRGPGVPVNLVKTFGDVNTDVGEVLSRIERGRETAILTRTLRERDTMREMVTSGLAGQGWSPEDLSGLKFSTIHASKGQEFQDVILPLNLLEREGRRDKSFPSPYAQSASELLEEERLFYVGMTRAEERLTVFGESRHPYMQALTGSSGEDAHRIAPYFDDAAPVSRRRGGGFLSGLRTIFGSPRNLFDFIRGGDERLGRLRGERDRRRGGGLDLHSGDRPLSEHILSEEYFGKAIERGSLSLNLGRYGSALYFSEGAHFRGQNVRGHSGDYGFLFDPVELENNYGAVVSPQRIGAIYKALLKKDFDEGKQLGDLWKSNTAGIDLGFFDRTLPDEWISGFVKDARGFREKTGIGLEWALDRQRKLGLSDVENEFISLEEIPISESVGLVRGGKPFLFKGDQVGGAILERGLRSPKAKDFIEAEPGTFGSSQGGVSLRYNNVASVRRAALRGSVLGKIGNKFGLDLHSGDVRFLDTQTPRAKYARNLAVPDDRTFGIEIEFLTRYPRASRSYLEQHFRDVEGLKFVYDSSISHPNTELDVIFGNREPSPLDFPDQASYQRNRRNRNWALAGEAEKVRRGQAIYSHELVSPVYRGEEGLKEFSKVIGRLNRFKPEFNTSVGMHIHTGIEGLHPREKLNIYGAFAAYEPAIDLLHESSRRGPSLHGYTKGLDLADFIAARLEKHDVMSREGGFYDWSDMQERLVTGGGIEPDRYRKLNILGNKGKTFEYRQPIGTTNMNEIASHVRFFTNFVEQFRRRPITSLGKGYADPWGVDVDTRVLTYRDAFEDLGLTYPDVSIFGEMRSVLNTDILGSRIDFVPRDTFKVIDTKDPIKNVVDPARERDRYRGLFEGPVADEADRAIAERERSSGQRIPSFLDLHSGLVGTGRVDSDHVFRFFGADERQRIFGGGRTPDDFSLDESVGLLKGYYGGAETVRDVIGRANLAENIFFRAQNAVGIGDYHSYDLSLTNIIQNAHPNFREGMIENVKRMAPDAYIKEGYNVFRQGVFASGKFADMSHYLDGIEMFTTDQTRRVEGGSLLHIFGGEGLSGEASHSSLLGESVVNAKRELYRIHKDFIGYTGSDSKVNYMDYPAELFAVDPRRRYLTTKRPLDLHSGGGDSGYGSLLKSIFGVPDRLVSHHTNLLSYESILDEGAVLSNRALYGNRSSTDFFGSGANMYDGDRLAGDDKYVFLGRYKKEGSLYGDYGLIFPGDKLIDEYKGVVAEEDLYGQYMKIREELREDYDYQLVQGQDPFTSPELVRDYQKRVGFLQKYSRFGGDEGREILDTSRYPELLVPDRVPISEAIGVFDEGTPMLISPETRGPDPDMWDLDIFPGGLDLHSGRRRLLHTTLRRNRESILRTGLDPGRSRGKRREVYLHTPSRQQWALDHMQKKYKAGPEDIDVFEVEVARKDLTRRWRGIWSTPKEIKNVNLLELHSGGMMEGLEEGLRDWDPLDMRKPAAPDPLSRSARQQWVADKGWIDSLDHLEHAMTNAAVIDFAGEAVFEGLFGIAGHEMKAGGFLRASAMGGVTLGLNRLNRRLGRSGLTPDVVPDVSEIHANAVVSGAKESLHQVFSEASQGRYGQGSLYKTLEGYGDEELGSMFGEGSARKLRTIASNARRFGQKSYQGSRDWGETILGLVTGDVPPTTRYVYDPNAGKVDVTRGKGFTLDRILESDRGSLLFEGWTGRRRHLRENPGDAGIVGKFLDKTIGPLQQSDAKLHELYMALPETGWVSKFLGRYRVSKGDSGDIAEIPSNILSFVGMKEAARKSREGYELRKMMRGDRALAFEERKLNPELYEWQSPEHFYEQTAAKLGIESIPDLKLRAERLGDPYSKWGRHLSSLPKSAKSGVIGGAVAGGAAAAYYAAEFFGQDDDFVLQDPHNYSMSRRYPLLKALSFSDPARRLRQRGDQVLTGLFGENTFHGEMMKSLVLGEKGNLPSSVKDTFLETGQYHALVQSGMHINLFAGLLRRYSLLGAGLALGVGIDTVKPPETDRIDSDLPWNEGYKLSGDPWLPRWNPEPGQMVVETIYENAAGKKVDADSGDVAYQLRVPQWKGRSPDFEPPSWAWWDTSPYSDEKYERRMHRLGGSRQIDRGYIYQIKTPEGSTYAGLSTNDPLSPSGRVRTHMLGRGNKGIADALKRYDESEFDISVSSYDNISYTELGRKERDLIARLGENALNRTQGGEMRLPSFGKEFLDVRPFRLQHLGAYATYSAFGILPESVYSEYKEARKMDSVEAFPQVRGLSESERVAPLIKRAIADEQMKHDDGGGIGYIDNETDDEDIDDLVDSILSEMELRRRASY